MVFLSLLAKKTKLSGLSVLTDTFFYSISISIQMILLSIWCFIMSEEYKFVAPGKLKLKGSALKIAKTSHNKTYANVPHQSIHQIDHFLIDLFIGKRRRVLLKS